MSLRALVWSLRALRDRLQLRFDPPPDVPGGGGGG